MPKQISWTIEQDDRIIAMRASRLSFDHIAEALGVSRQAVTDRSAKIGAILPSKHRDADDSDRDALPAGSPSTWALLTAGTSLEGAAYPLPVFHAGTLVSA